MTGPAQPLNGHPLVNPDLMDRIAAALPEELRADYYRELSHCRTLPENDEMLRILRAMQFLTILIERAPRQVAIEREQIAQVLAHSIESIQAMHEATLTYQKELEARLAKLPQEIAKGINAEAIAAKINESLRQRFQETGLPETANSIAAQVTTLRQASKELSGALSEFAHPTNGAVPRVNKAISSMNADLKNAADHERVQMNGLGKELWRTIAILCFATLVAGFGMGTLYHRWIDAAQVSAVPSAPVLKSAPPSASEGAPKNHKKRAQKTTSSQ